MAEAADKSQFVVPSVPLVVGSEPTLAATAELTIARSSAPSRRAGTLWRTLPAIAALVSATALAFGKLAPQREGVGTAAAVHPVRTVQAHSPASPKRRRPPRPSQTPAARRTRIAHVRHRARQNRPRRRAHAQ